MKAPIKIDEVLAGSHAEECGVKKGWQVKFIDGVEVSGKPYSFITKALQAGLETLPWEKAPVHEPGLMQAPLQSDANDGGSSKKTSKRLGLFATECRQLVSG